MALINLYFSFATLLLNSHSMTWQLNVNNILFCKAETDANNTHEMDLYKKKDFYFQSNMKFEYSEVIKTNIISCINSIQDIPFY